MGLKIQTTGLEQYAAGGEGRLQVMIIGGPGVGKTRFSSFWPRPIYANCEAGLASIADRKMPFVDIKRSQDMLDLLTFLQMECRRPYRDRQFQTVVIDTLDAFQRAVKDEWLQQNPNSQSFRGFDAWGYLDAKMQMLLTRLLALDMNVIVLAHYKDKTIKEGTGENATERQELMLQLSGEVKDSVFNDFDLVGFMGTFWAAEDGKRVLKRGITFKADPKYPFLKDRLNVTPEWMEVKFSDEDYTNLFAAVTARLDDFEPSQEIGEIGPAVPESAQPTAGVVGPTSGGPVAPADPKEIPLETMDKPTLQKMARDLGLAVRNNHIRAELIQMIKDAQAEADKVAAAGEPSAAQSDAAAATPEAGPAASAPDSAAPTAEPTKDAPATPVQTAPVDDNPKQKASQPEQAAPVALEDLAADAVTTPAAADTVDTEVGKVDPNTGVMTEEQVAEALGGQVVSVDEPAEAKAVAPQTAPAAQPQSAPAPLLTGGRPTVCERPGCEKPLAGENQDYVKLSQIKFRTYLCNEDFLSRKAGAWS